MSEDSKDSHHHHFLPHHHHRHEGDQPPPPPHEYGTFQAPTSYPPHQPVIGFPQPVPPPGVTASSPEYYAHGYQAVPGYTVSDPEGRPEREHRLPCCGIGLGWFLFIIGFFLAGIPWYLAAFVLLCAQIDPREKPGYITCTIAAVLATFVLIFGLSKT
ncbi:PREDICTED: 60S ribosomal protein L18a-like protein [Nicotiana attenuata]|uniref:60S ribosomal protein L18a-like protein n=1 Tax=Nicotiana attenuata TaxID=49451 RepID=UPI0009055145|nr:PREDICTED: 60S ribosomal protein L18a-like protein [Nicotiana attenuata]